MAVDRELLKEAMKKVIDTFLDADHRPEEIALVIVENGTLAHIANVPQGRVFELIREAEHRTIDRARVSVERPN